MKKSFNFRRNLNICILNRKNISLVSYRYLLFFCILCVSLFWEADETVCDRDEEHIQETRQGSPWKRLLCKFLKPFHLLKFTMIHKPAKHSLHFIVKHIKHGHGGRGQSISLCPVGFFSSGKTR